MSPLTERDLVVEQRLTTLEVLVDEVRGIADDARTMIAQVRVWMVIASAVGGAAVTVATGVAIWWMTK